jgi:hypothetical protein
MAYLHRQCFSVLDATAASDTAQIWDYSYLWMRLSHLTLKITVHVNRPLGFPSISKIAIGGGGVLPSL